MMMQVSDLTIARGGIPVLEGVRFTLSPGQALVVRGPNGIGKTTLLRTIAGLQPPVSGRIDVPPESLVYAGHADGIKATLTVTENLKFWAEAFGRKDYSQAIEAFRLTALSARLAGALSAGQKRRLGLARLLVTGRAIWVLDEPTVSLDTEAVAMFAHAVRGHLATGGMALMATHIDIGLSEAQVLDVGKYKAKPLMDNDFDGAFL
ncbi:Cytochrome c biogenesis ATP-binding export protein CcmA [Roseovarius sp. EC-HK134]|uniref:heme ABC exporter ATP-binding protein CcmA n=1 Tax=Roseovarius TaxID=74030 RepID=UPI001259860A|nr:MULTISPECIES: heme ABC exporter ATP-binding protein CcmA [unclassified Roseovarius]VVT32235.1 Cytochrome c biogenesis ATP-binding export protein CcmA [Roseovarius sp. EC-HK134]VVT32504.1 Cytochrome c biogenesis ATP-binding export protein CcmA [Roseovarius sp. EC-SD190]